MPRVWKDTTININVATASQGVASLMGALTPAQTRFDQMILLRTIVGIDIAYTVHDSGEGSQLVSVGIGVASQEAFAAGALPDPETDTDFPTRGWVWRAKYRIFGFAADQPAIFVRRIDLDLRSQRKLENGESFFNAFNAAHEGTATSISLTGLIRQLWLVG